MRHCKRCTKMMMAVLMALLPALFLVGCRGNLGWDRMDGPPVRQGQSRMHQLP
jgi:hypothetical protein